jgi:hypothetical protein
VGLLVAPVLTLASCGGASHKRTAQPSGPRAGTISLSISESGRTATYRAPAVVTGGLVNMLFTNKGRALHAAQLIRVIGNRSALSVLKLLAGNSRKTPSYLHAEGGIGPTEPGTTLTATLNLPPGNYLVVDVAGPSSGPPAYGQFTVIPGATGALPATGATVTAAKLSKDHYRWRFNGRLTHGVNTVTFASKGTNALHLIGVVRLLGPASNAQIIRGLSSNGKPPAFFDPTSLYTSGALDGGKSQVTPLPLLSPGRYVLFCPLRDRAGGKPHLQEGMLATIIVK